MVISYVFFPLYKPGPAEWTNLPTDPMLHSHVWTDLKNISQLIQITSEDFALTVQSFSDPGILFIC